MRETSTSVSIEDGKKHCDRTISKFLGIVETSPFFNSSDRLARSSIPSRWCRCSTSPEFLGLRSRDRLAIEPVLRWGTIARLPHPRPWIPVSTIFPRLNPDSINWHRRTIVDRSNWIEAMEPKRRNFTKTLNLQPCQIEVQRRSTIKIQCYDEVYQVRVQAFSDFGTCLASE